MTCVRGAARSGIVVVACVVGCSGPKTTPTMHAGPALVVEPQRREEELVFHGNSVRDYDRNLPDVDAIGYDADLAVDEARPGHETFRATVIGSFIATRPLDVLTLDFEGNEIDGVEVEKTPARYRREGATLKIELPKLARTGRALVVTIRYHGLLFQANPAHRDDFRGYGGFMALQKNREGKKIYSTLSWPYKARRWLPLRDHPSDGAMWSVRATFPSAYEVVSNGALKVSRPNADGTRSWQYEALDPMPVYDFYLGAYGGWAEQPFVATSGSHGSCRAYEKDAAAARALCGDLGAAMDFYEATFGPFRWDHAGFLEVPIFHGGMEHATVVGLDESLFENPRSSRNVAFHELAHHWSGNLVRIASWNDFWLSEGFSEYLTRRFVSAHDGPEAAKTLWRQSLSDAFRAEKGDHRHALRPADPEVDVLTIFDEIPYQKGPWVLRMLEHQLGEAKLTTFLRRWFDVHQFRAVTTAMFERELGEFAGVDLASFFAQWVYGERNPVVAVTRRYDAAARSLELVVDQTMDGGAFRFPLELELRSGTQSQRTTIEVAGKQTIARVKVAFEPASIIVDPDGWLYLESTVR